MKYEFEVYQMQVEEHLFWVAKSKVLKGCVGQGETSDEAIKELEENEVEWLNTAAECDILIPSITLRTDSAYSGKISLRFSPFMHETASDYARQQGISLNQYINDAIVFYNGLMKEKITSKPLISKHELIDTETTTIISFTDAAKRKTSAMPIITVDDQPEEM